MIDRLKEHDSAGEQESQKELSAAAPDVSGVPPTDVELNENQHNQPSTIEEPLGSLELVVLDANGAAIPKLPIRLLELLDQKIKLNRIILDGITDAKGALPVVESLKVGTVFEVQIKNDAGIYKMAAIGKIQAPKCNHANLKIPRQRFEFSTFAHSGRAGTADEKKKNVVASHNQNPDSVVNIARSKEKKPSLIVDRDSQGRPKGLVNYGVKNLHGENNIKPTAVNVSKSSLDKVNALIEFAMKQTTWKHSNALTSASIIQKMKAGAYSPEANKGGNGYKNSIHRCTKYVKIALWYSGYSHNDGDIAPTVSPARDMGPALLSAGFKDITGTLPDARWAAPGDVIVYKKKGDAGAAGHIDIRTYDGYVSDFFENYLPVTGFEVIGIYRKYYDPLPELRMRAFLKVIRSREAKTVFQNYGDESTYRTLPERLKIGLMFNDFATHPFEVKGGKTTASGAYGILLSTWKRYTDPSVNPKPWVPLSEKSEKFSPIVQDRIAIASMELHLGVGYGSNEGITSLGLIRRGEIKQAAKLLSTRKPYQWTSLPGGTESKYTEAEMLADYEKFYEELRK